MQVQLCVFPSAATGSSTQPVCLRYAVRSATASFFYYVRLLAQASRVRISATGGGFGSLRRPYSWRRRARVSGRRAYSRFFCNWLCRFLAAHLSCADRRVARFWATVFRGRCRSGLMGAERSWAFERSGLRFTSVGAQQMRGRERASQPSAT